MFKCTCWITFGLSKVGTNQLEYFKIATYNRDIGLRVGDLVAIHHIQNEDISSGFDYIPPNIEIQAIVKERINIIIPNAARGEDIFETRLFLEIADKEIFKEMRETIKAYNPGKFKDIEPENKE